MRGGGDLWTLELSYLGSHGWSGLEYRGCCAGSLETGGEEVYLVPCPRAGTRCVTAPATYRRGWPCCFGEKAWWVLETWSP